MNLSGGRLDVQGACAFEFLPFSEGPIGPKINFYATKSCVIGKRAV